MKVFINFEQSLYTDIVQSHAFFMAPIPETPNVLLHEFKFEIRADRIIAIERWRERVISFCSMPPSSSSGSVAGVVVG